VLTRVPDVLQCLLIALVLVFGCAAPAAASTAAAAPTPSPAPPSGSLGLRLLDVPIAARNDPRAQIYIVDRLAPGAVIHRRIEVSNTTISTLHVVLYSAAATIASGSFLGAAGHTANALSTWTSVSPGIANVPPSGRAIVTLTVAVPRDATQGEQYAVVWAEVRSNRAVAGGVVQVSRVGIRIYASIGPGGAPASDFTINSLTAERSPAGRPMVLATVQNTGGRALDMSGTLRLDGGPAGLRAGPFPAALGTTLAIGDTEPVTIVLDGRLPAGPWDARITLRSGLITHSARATITFPSAGAAPVRFSTAHHSSARYIAIVAIIVALGAAILLVTVRRRLRTSL
jgi:hypothetical protein